MKSGMKCFGLLMAAIPCAPVVAQAQIVPASDGTGTIAAPEGGNTIEIRGGTLGSDRANLFHSFEQFGLNANQIANFISQPEIHNILGRVVGGNPSMIDGVLKVTGGNSNLFLMNPSGIVFGPNASLSLPGSFTATTATGMGFGNSWFNGYGSNNYAALVGTPTSFAFDVTQPGAIVNSGNLAVTPGQNLTLVGGTVVSNGTLVAPGGNIMAAAVPGASRVRLSQTGNLLSLEVEQNQLNQTLVADPLSLPELLTGAKNHAPNLTVNGNGEVALGNSGIKIAAGDVAIKELQARNATLSATRNLTLVESQLQTSGNLNLLAKDTVQVRDSQTGAVAVKAGGDLRIQGDRSIDILALNHTQTPFKSGGNLTLASDGVISGDAHFSSRGNFSIQTLSGTPGNFVSLYDPIITSDGNISFAGYTGASLKVEAKGSINVTGDIVITAADTSGAIPASDPDFATLTGGRALILRAGVATATDNVAFDYDYLDPDFYFTTFSKSATTSPATINVAGTIDSGVPFTTTAPLRVSLSAPGNVTTQTIRSYGADIDITSTGGSIYTEDPVNQTYSLDSRNGASNAGNITLNAAGTITTGEVVSYAFDNTGVGTTANGGNINITATGNVKVDSLNSLCNGCTSGKAGNVTVKSGNDIDVTQVVDARSIGPGTGGQVYLESGRYLRVSNVFVDPALNPNFSIDTSGGGGGGSVVIINQTGVTGNFAPFVVGNASVNGTASSINTGTSTIAPSTSFTTGTTVGNIQINFGKTATNSSTVNGTSTDWLGRSPTELPEEGLYLDKKILCAADDLQELPGISKLPHCEQLPLKETPILKPEQGQ
jgi:filamentous hemagglutinin family protein